MIVEVVSYKATNVGRSRSEVDPLQYMVKVNGAFAGFVSYTDDASIRLHKRFSPMDLRDIEAGVREQLEGLQTVGTTVQPPEPREKKPVEKKLIITEDFV